jgi:glycosyltransferase involved in cell wall biosynthesis
MNIAVDAKRLFNNFTGLGNYSRSLLRNLQHYYPEHQYHLFTPNLNKTEETADFFEDKKFHLHQSTARLKAYWRSFSIVKDLQKTGIEIYHGLSNELPHQINKTGIKSVVTIHDLIFKVYPETYSLSERIIYDRKFRYACQQADKIVAISENTKKDIIKWYQIPQDKIEVVYQTCHPIFYTQCSDEQNLRVLQQYHLPQEYLLYVGSVEPRKNIKLIIEAYQLMHQEIKIPMVIIGRGGQYKVECKKMITASGLTNAFIWVENLNNNIHLKSIYQSAKALIYPSLYEGFGLPIAEALLSKTPVIAADTSSLREAGGPDSLYIAPQQAKELADAILSLLKDNNLAEQMSIRGYEYAIEHFAPQKLSAQMMELYKSL